MTSETAFNDLKHRVVQLETEVEMLRGLIDGELTEQSPSLGEESMPDPRPPSNGDGVDLAGMSSKRKHGGGPGSIVDWFEKRGLTVEVNEETAADRVFDRMAEYLGDHYADLQRLAGGIRWTILEGKNTAFSLSKMSESEREHVLTFAQMLNDRAFLTYFNHNDSSGRLSLQAKVDQRLLQFINGHWLERYVLVKGEKCFRGASPDFASARNIQVRGVQSAGSFEMDVVFLVDGEPIWVECKSRDFRRDIDKYAERAGALGISLDRTMVVVQSFENAQAEEAAADIPGLFGLSVIDTDGLTARLEAIAAPGGAARGGADLELPEDEEEALVSRLGGFLAQSQLSPQPGSRRELLAALLRAVEEGMPATAGELRERMRAAVAPSLAQGAHPVLVAVRRGGGLLDGDGNPSMDPALSVEVSGLAAADIDGLEALCRSGYEDAIERKMPGVASRPDFKAVFERVIDGDDRG